MALLRPVSTQPRAHSAHGDLLFTYLILRNLSNRQRSKCVRLVVELKSTPALDILVAPIRFVVDVNKLYFPGKKVMLLCDCLLYTSPSPRDGLLSRMPSSA